MCLKLYYCELSLLKSLGLFKHIMFDSVVSYKVKDLSCFILECATVSVENFEGLKFRGF